MTDFINKGNNSDDNPISLEAITNVGTPPNGGGTPPDNETPPNSNPDATPPNNGAPSPDNGNPTPPNSTNDNLSFTGNYELPATIEELVRDFNNPQLQEVVAEYKNNALAVFNGSTFSTNGDIL